MTTIKGEENIKAFAVRMLFIGLKFEARSGMKMSRVSAVQSAKRLGYKGRTAKQLLQSMMEQHPELKEIQ